MQRIPIDPIGSNVDHFTPGLAVDKNTAGDHAHLALTYYYFAHAGCTNATCELYAGQITSANGGKSWSHRLQLAGPMSITWLANTDAGYMTGDYISTSISLGLAVTIIPVATAPQSAGVYNEAMYASTFPVIGGDVLSGNDPVVYNPYAQAQVHARSQTVTHSHAPVQNSMLKVATAN